ncbi:MAG: leucine-rich repeat domain-containing protein [Armatimonadota bacterium]
MSKPKKTDTRQEFLDKLALAPPKGTVLSDHALPAEEAFKDSFKLSYKLGPVFDILRYPNTRMPMAIAIYGDWGTGKTSAMRWLDYLLDRWNKDGKDDNKQKVSTIWFYPWKYHTKEDVWRGLISEVIIKSIDIQEVNITKVISAVKQFGMFLGRSFVHTVAAMSPNAKAIEDILKEYREVSHPEHAYLNDFENALKKWVKNSLNRNERMVVFIDDLDRCMPDVALEVLEALKLYLNIDRMIFVVGVDKIAINELVKEHCTKLGLSEERSGNYLAKMFQVEVELSHGEQQIEDYLEEQLKGIGYMDKLTDKEQGIFRKLILKFGGENPREIKRLVNSAVMAGAGALTVVNKDDGDKSLYTFSQGMQMFFVRRILQQKQYGWGQLVGKKVGDRLFGIWSKIVCENGGKAEIPQIKYIPQSFIDQQVGFAEGLDYEAKENREGRKLSFAPNEYHSILNDRELCKYCKILSDPDLLELMQIEYPSSTGALAYIMGNENDSDIVRSAIARQLDKKPEELTKDDYSKITDLGLSRSFISSLTPLKGLTQLQKLWLDGSTQVSDITPLEGLTRLQILWLNSTHVTDITPLKGLTQLQKLVLNVTQVTDITPLKGLTELQELWLGHIQVSDIIPLKGLAQLQTLWLDNTQVFDITPLEGLTGLQALVLNNTQVIDITPLKGLTQLQDLSLDGTAVSDLTPLKGLARLQTLWLNSTQVIDITPLKELIQLQELWLEDTQVSDISVDELKAAIPRLKVYR